MPVFSGPRTGAAFEFLILFGFLFITRDSALRRLKRQERRPAGRQIALSGTSLVIIAPMQSRAIVIFFVAIL